MPVARYKDDDHDVVCEWESLIPVPVPLNIMILPGTGKIKGCEHQIAATGTGTQQPGQLLYKQTDRILLKII